LNLARALKVDFFLESEIRLEPAKARLILSPILFEMAYSAFMKTGIVFLILLSLSRNLNSTAVRFGNPVPAE